ncbi:MAG TPA: YtxH domain-containing protein [Ignavibacteriaceae bacterium]|nr:YtxH domain-containing protein [Ignavibacteriaceae bacterium]
MSQEKSGKGLLLGFLAGGAVGAILALLYAPKSGRELREDIRSKTDEYYDDVEKYYSEARNKAKDLINDGKKKSEKLISDARVKSEELLKDAERIFNDAKSKAEGYVAKGKETIDQESAKMKTAIKAGVDAYKETKRS